MITTSYVGTQAYDEILTDGHPIVIVTGRNIIEYIHNELEINTIVGLKDWLSSNF